MSRIVNGMLVAGPGQVHCSHRRRVLVAGERDGRRIRSRGLICRDCGAAKPIRLAEGVSGAPVGEWGEPIDSANIAREIARGDYPVGSSFRLLRSRSPRTTHPALGGRP